MCTECFTRQVRDLVSLPPDASWYYTLRIGEALSDPSPVIICGPQSEIAGFDFFEVNEHGIPRKAASPSSNPAKVRAFLRVIDPADWARFLRHYAMLLGKDVDYDLEAIVADLETEAAALYPEASEYARLNPIGGDPDLDDE